MQNSKAIAGILGPTMIAMLLAEFPLVQPQLYDAQIPPVVYLSGTLMFMGGLAVVRVHNFWRRNWTILVTLSGWFFLILGLIRMFTASRYHQEASATPPAVFMVLEAVLLVVALYMTYQAYLGADD